MFLVFCFVACDHENQYTPEEQEPITNDFTLLKACIGKSQSEVSALLTNHDFTSASSDKFLKTVDGVTKEVHIYSIGNVEMDVHNNDFDTLKQVFVQWLNEIRNSVAYTKLVRSSFKIYPGMVADTNSSIHQKNSSTLSVQFPPLKVCMQHSLEMTSTPMNTV